MRVLVVGSRSFVGRRVAERLRAAHSVETAGRDAGAELRLALGEPARLPASGERRYDAVVHCAASFEPDTPAGMISNALVNAVGALEVGELAVRTGCRQHRAALDRLRVRRARGPAARLLLAVQAPRPGEPRAAVPGGGDRALHAVPGRGLRRARRGAPPPAAPLPHRRLRPSRRGLRALRHARPAAELPARRRSGGRDRGGAGIGHRAALSRSCTRTSTGCRRSPSSPFACSVVVAGSCARRKSRTCASCASRRPATSSAGSATRRSSTCHAGSSSMRDQLG